MWIFVANQSNPAIGKTIGGVEKKQYSFSFVVGMHLRFDFLKGISTILMFHIYALVNLQIYLVIFTFEFSSHSHQYFCL